MGMNLPCEMLKFGQLIGFVAVGCVFAGSPANYLLKRCSGLFLQLVLIPTLLSLAVL